MDNSVVDANWRDWEGNHHLHLSVQRDDEEMVSYLLQRGCDANARNCEGNAPLVLANFANPRMVRMLLNAGADVPIFAGTNWQTGLHMAVLGRCLESVILILDSSYCPYINFKDRRDKTALDYAVEADSIEIAQLILKKIAESHPCYFKMLVDEAVMSPKESTILRILEDNSLNVKVGDSILLHFTVCLPDTDMTLSMIQTGVDVNKQDSSGLSGLHRAIQYNNSRQVQLLLEHGADLSLRTNDGDTVLHSNTMWKFHLKLYGYEESERQEYDIHRLLLAKGADCNAGNKYGCTPLHLAARCKSSAIIKSFLDNGADVKATDINGWTALHSAALNLYADTFEYLIHRGSDMECKTKDGRTALHCSVMHNNLRMCKSLLTNGAMINARCAKNTTPLVRAVDGKCEGMFRMLLQYEASVADSFKFNDDILEKLLNIPVDDYGYREMRCHLIKHIAQMKSLNSSLNEIERQIENSICHDTYYHTCLRELENMKKTKFYNNVSVFSILTGRRRVISGYARNNELLNALKEVNSEEFRMYFESLKERFYAAVELRKLEDAAADILDYLFEFNDPFYVVSYKIVNHLRPVDLKYSVIDLMSRYKGD